MRGRHSGTVLSVLVAAFALGACNAVQVPDVALFEAPAGGGGSLALLSGTLEAQGSCLVLVDGDGTVWTVAWPSPGTVWEYGKAEIALRDVRAPYGSKVALSGAEALGAAGSTDWIVRPRQECLEHRVWRAYAMTLSP